ncbi:MAG: hypothetical protein AB7F85_09910 [Hyphomonadaceae bacterium]
MLSTQLGVLVMASWFLAACTPSISSRCDVTSIEAVFASPLAFHGQRFCGTGYIAFAAEVTGIYANPVERESDMLDVALVLDAGTSQNWPGGWTPANNSEVYIEGILDAQSCNVMTPSDVDDGADCAPVARAIFVSEWRIRPWKP